MTNPVGWNGSLALFGITGSIGGSSISAGASATGTISIPGASALVQANGSFANVSGATIEVTPNFQGGPGNGFIWRGYLDASTTDLIDIVVTNVTSGSLTPTAGTYAVKVTPF
jgi:hypothetical protein